jgi:hypothetical protein
MMNKKAARVINMIGYLLRPTDLDEEYWIIERSSEWYKAHYGVQNEAIMA